jgi:hypothetical protein
VPDALRAAGASVVVHDEIFTDTTSDVEWLSECGRRGWVVLTRDGRIRYRPAEIATLRNGGCLVVVVTAKTMTGAGDAALLVRALPNLIELAASSDRPAVYRMASDCRPNRMV